MSVTVARAEPSIAGAGDYIELMKPRVMSLVVFTLFVMLLVDGIAGGLFAPLWDHFPAGA